MASIVPGTVMLVHYPELSSKSCPKPQRLNSHTSWVPVPAPRYYRVPGDPISPHRGQRGTRPPPETWGDAASSLHWGFHWQWGVSFSQLLLTVLGSHRDRIQLPCWRLILTLQEPQTPKTASGVVDCGHSSLGLGVPQPSAAHWQEPSGAEQPE